RPRLPSSSASPSAACGIGSKNWTLTRLRTCPTHATMPLERPLPTAAELPGRRWDKDGATWGSDLQAILPLACCGGASQRTIARETYAREQEVLIYDMACLCRTI